MKLIKEIVTNLIGLFVLLIIINYFSGGKVVVFINNMYGYIDYASVRYSSEIKGSDTSYDLLRKAIWQSIERNSSKETFNEEALWLDYCMLFDLYLEEYFFKSYAYVQYYPDFEIGERYSSIAKQCERVLKEMKKYFVANVIEGMSVNVAQVQDRTYKNMQFPDRNKPNIDDLWLEYCDILITQSPFDVYYNQFVVN